MAGWYGLLLPLVQLLHCSFESLRKGLGVSQFGFISKEALHLPPCLCNHGVLSENTPSMPATVRCWGHEHVRHHPFFKMVLDLRGELMTDVRQQSPKSVQASGNTAPRSSSERRMGGSLYWGIRRSSVTGQRRRKEVTVRDEQKQNHEV